MIPFYDMNKSIWQFDRRFPVQIAVSISCFFYHLCRRRPKSKWLTAYCQPILISLLLNLLLFWVSFSSKFPSFILFSISIVWRSIYIGSHLRKWNLIRIFFFFFFWSEVSKYPTENNYEVGVFGHGIFFSKKPFSTEHNQYQNQIEFSLVIIWDWSLCICKTFLDRLNDETFKRIIAPFM